MCRQADTIVIAEDNAPYRQLLRIVMEANGLTVVCAEDGATALAATLAHRPAIALLDICMPGMNGVEAAIAIRYELGEGAPVLIALSALTNGRLDTVRESGVFDAVYEKTKDIFTVQQQVRALWAAPNPLPNTAM